MEKTGYKANDMKSLCVAGSDITHTTEVTGELIMPDYYPEIRKVISLWADAIPDSKYLSEGAVETGGTLAFSLLYIGDDGTLVSVPYVTEYSQSIDPGADFKGSSADIRVESCAEGASCRPLAPRTVALKAKVKSRMSYDRSEGCAMDMISMDQTPATPQMERTLELLENRICMSERRTAFATGSIRNEIANPEKAKPVICRGEILPDSAMTSRDSVILKGTYVISCLVLTFDGMYKTVTTSVPFEEHISAEGAVQGLPCAFTAKAASVSVSCDSDGEKLIFDGEYDLLAVYSHNSNIEATEDVYSTEYALELQRKDLDVLSLLCLENSSLEISGEGRRKSGHGENDRIIFHTAEAKIERADRYEDTVRFTGSCNFKVFIASDGDVITEEFSVPLKYECKKKSSDGACELIWHAQLYPGIGECRLDDTRLIVKYRMGIFAEAVEKRRISPVTSAVFGPKDTKKEDASLIHICYPEKGQRIWDIAKECRSPISECERTNKVSRHELSDGTPIVVTSR